jgi:hypothetical protein
MVNAPPCPLLKQGNLAMSRNEMPLSTLPSVAKYEIIN